MEITKGREGVKGAAREPQLGAILRNWRSKHGFTQEYTARLFGVTWRTVAYWEAGDRAPGMATLARACKHKDPRVVRFARLLIGVRFPAVDELPYDAVRSEGELS